MKKTIISLLASLALTYTVIGQAPQKMSYQAVIRNSTNNLVTSSPVGMRVSVLQGTTSGTVVFQEIYNPNPQTNVNGLVSIEIGKGIATVGSFSAIDWSVGPYFIKTETDPSGGTSYTISGTQQLMSVPYALYAATSGNSSSSLLPPTTTTLAATSVTGASAILNGTINPNGLRTEVIFEYGLTSAYGTTILGLPSELVGNSSASVSQTISGLVGNSVYHYRVAGGNAMDDSKGVDLTFTTQNTPPSAVRISYSDSLANDTMRQKYNKSATVFVGFVNPNNAVTTVTFEYGTTTSYGNVVGSTPRTVQGASEQVVSSWLAFLDLGQYYYVRMKAENSSGVIYSSPYGFYPR